MSLNGHIALWTIIREVGGGGLYDHLMNTRIVTFDNEHDNIHTSFKDYEEVVTTTIWIFKPSCTNHVCFIS